VQKVIYKYARLAKVPGTSVHSLRHTFGTYHAAKGTSIKTIQEVMGHKDVRNTEVYLSLARELQIKDLQGHAL